MNKITRLRKKADVLAWRIAVIKKGIDCEICGEPMDDVHHCYRKGTYPHLRYDFDNLSILCRECHDKPDYVILNELDKKRGKKWIKRLNKKAKECDYTCINISFYENNIKALKLMDI